MNIEYLRTVDFIARTGSFSEAGRRLNLSQPAVSLQVKEVEQRLGVRLFERRRAPVELTDAGQELLPIIRSCLDSYDHLLSLSGEGLEANRSTLRIGAGHTAAEHLVPTLLGLFHAQHPGCELRLVVPQEPGDLYRAVFGRSIDLAILHFEPFVPDPDLEIVIVGTERIIPVLPPDHRFAGASVVLREFLSEEFVARDAKSTTRQSLDKALRAAGMPGIRYQMELRSNEAVKETIKAGLGIGFLPVCAVRGDLLAERLATCYIEDFAVSRPVRIVARRDNTRPVVRSFFAFLQGAVGPIRALFDLPVRPFQPVGSDAPVG